MDSFGLVHLASAVPEVKHGTLKQAVALALLGKIGMETPA